MQRSIAQATVRKHANEAKLADKLSAKESSVIALATANKAAEARLRAARESVRPCRVASVGFGSALR